MSFRLVPKSVTLNDLERLLWLSANLECMSEMCCTRLAGNTGRKKIAIWTLSHKLSGYIFAPKACIDSRKNLLNNNISSTCPHNMVNFGSLTAKICWRI